MNDAERFFLGLGVSQALAGAAGRVRSAAAPGLDVRFVDPADLHLTLRYLGPLPDPARDAVIEALRPPLGAPGVPSVRVRGLDSFGDRARPRVLYAALAEPAWPVAQLAEALDERLAPWLLPARQAPFVPHITLARSRSPAGAAGLAVLRDRLADLDLGPLALSPITLYRSGPVDKSPRYAPVFAFTAGTMPDVTERMKLSPDRT